MRRIRLSIALASAVASVAAMSLVPAATAADARAPKPVITSVQAKVGSSVGYTHLVIRGRHLGGGKVMVAGRKVYAKVVNSHVIAAYPGGHRHGKKFAVVVETKVGKSNAKRYEYRYARQPGTLHAAALPTVPGGTVGSLRYTITRCPVAGTCVSIGSDDNAAGLVARATTRGHTTTQRIPMPADFNNDGSGALYDLACPTATYCAAAGDYNAGSLGLVATWNGSTWTSRATPTPAGNPYPNHGSQQVSCGAPGHCVIADLEQLYTLDGATLRLVPSLAPRGSTYVRYAKVSCPSAGWCTVVGSAGTSKSAHNYQWIRGGTTWTTHALADPAGKPATPDVDGLDCVAADRCTVLVGGRDQAPIHFGALHAGTVGWTTAPLPADHAKGTAWAVDFGNIRLSCPSGTTCWAAAEYTVAKVKGQRGHQPVALRLHGSKVTVFALPRPASSRTGRLGIQDLSCATASSCVAVGGRGDKDADNVHGDAIVETFAHGVWTPAAAPSPVGRPKYSDYAFTSVDCSGVGRCTAVGEYDYDHDPDAEDGQPLYRQRPVVLEIVPR